MLKVPQILVRAITLVGGAAVLAACGQKGGLLLPTEAAARQRATLVQVVRPDWARSRAAAPAAGASATPAALPTAPSATEIPTGPTGIAAPPTLSDLVPESTMDQ